MWIWLWVLLSAFVLSVFVWSMRILIQQKRAWSAYAKKHGYEYQGGKMTDAPYIIGNVANGRRLICYTDVQKQQDMRGERYVTVIEIEMGPGMPTGAALGTQSLRPFIDSLSFEYHYKPEKYDAWKNTYFAKTRSPDLLEAYLTPDRLKTLMAVFGMKNSNTLFFFDEKDAVLRIETSDPLRNQEQMEKIIKGILGAVEKLGLTEEERDKIEEELEAKRKEERKKRKKKRKKKEQEKESEQADDPAEDDAEDDASDIDDDDLSEDDDQDDEE